MLIYFAVLENPDGKHKCGSFPGMIRDGGEVNQKKTQSWTVPIITPTSILCPHFPLHPEIFSNFDEYLLTGDPAPVHIRQF